MPNVKYAALVYRNGDAVHPDCLAGDPDSKFHMRAVDEYRDYWPKGKTCKICAKSGVFVSVRETTKYDDGTGLGDVFYTLFRGDKPLENFKTQAMVVYALSELSKKHPGTTASVRTDRTSDGTRFVRDGHAYGRMVASYDNHQDGRGRYLLVY